MAAGRETPPPKPRWPKWAKGFLEALRITGVHSHAAKAAKVDRTLPYKLKKENLEFSAAYDDAVDESTDVILLEARRRAVDGVDEPVIYKGELMGAWVDRRGRPAEAGARGAKFIPLTVKKYSDSLILAILRARRPEFRDKAAVEVTGKGGGPMEMKHSGDVDINAKLDQLAGSFAAAAHRTALERGVPADGAGEPVHPDLGEPDDGGGPPPAEPAAS